jgi:23S rRNA-/tRNA-specific pseudouridylate synthase
MAATIVVAADDPRGKEAILHYEVRGRGNDWTWLEIELQTGRTHQIRVQAASRGLPVLGDAQYGSRRAFGDSGLDERQAAIALHARELAFAHPMTRESVHIVAPLPAAWHAFGIG